jgi:hypothetical protein
MKKQCILVILTLLCFSNNALSQAPSYLPADSLVGWYPFSASPNDESGNGNHGTRNGASLVNDRHGNAMSAYSFDGVNEYISLYGLTNFDFGQSYTQSCWIFLYNSGGGGPIASKRPWAYPRIVHNTNKVQFYATASGHTSAVAAETGSINPNVWYHFTFVKDSSSYMLYMNGVLADSVYDSHYISGTSTSVYRIGAHSPDFPFKGVIDDFAVWNRALNSAEIVSLYNACETVSSSQEVVSCGPFTWTNGITYANSNTTAQDTFVVGGCDSVVTLNLTVKNTDSIITQQPVDQSVTLSNDAYFLIASNDSLATYQWQTDVGFGFQNISNAGQYNGVDSDSLTISNSALSNDNQTFRCIVNSNDCMDTSNTVSLSVRDNASIDKNKISHSLTVYPNPTTNQIKLSGGANLVGSTYAFYSFMGKVLFQGVITSKDIIINLQEFEAGVYLIKVDGDLQQSIRVVKI